jgi:uncharacterized protein involved in exopolysaccharide biosynthesis
MEGEFFLCFISGMGKPDGGQYRKGRQHITEAVVRVDTSKLKTMEPEASNSQIQMRLAKNHAWMIAASLVGIVASVILTIYLLLKREHQISNFRQEMHDFQRQIDEYDRRFREMERRMVAQDTKIESMKDDP